MKKNIWSAVVGILKCVSINFHMAIVIWKNKNKGEFLDGGTKCVEIKLEVILCALCVRGEGVHECEQ